MSETDLSLVAHLMRRAGFGSTRSELETLGQKPYEDIVEDLLFPERSPGIERDLLDRYLAEPHAAMPVHIGIWIYRMINSKRPLEEKIALFWHHVFATGFSKVMHPMSNANQVEMFRSVGLSKLDEILLALSKDPAMIFWLDNSENHGDEINENYGRELLELFSMGVGNYTEDDIKNCARAFTGWTFTQPIPIYPQGDFPSYFHYREDDHDSSVKTFLGETGQFDGADIIKIIVKQPATAKFVSRHLYNFFVADEPQVPAWDELPPQDSQAIDMLSKAFTDSEGDMRSVLRVLFNSEFFKQSQFKRVKCPAELVAGVIKLTGTNREPNKQLEAIGVATAAMGQELYNPPTVEGWHTGKEWIDGGALNERVNFAVNELDDISNPGLKDFVQRLSDSSQPLDATNLVNRCVEFVGGIDLAPITQQALVAYGKSCGEITFDTEEEVEGSTRKIVRLLQLIVASREYQFA
tara:strand:- start:5204 stop:6601 length:1398 start_codon:yes stop_codon:yes gene_type:complete